MQNNWNELFIIYICIDIKQNRISGKKRIFRIFLNHFKSMSGVYFKIFWCMNAYYFELFNCMQIWILVISDDKNMSLCIHKVYVYVSLCIYNIQFISLFMDYTSNEVNKVWRKFFFIVLLFIQLHSIQRVLTSWDIRVNYKI